MGNHSMLIAALITRLDIQAIAKQSAYNATNNMCEVGNLIRYKDAINDLASNKELPPEQRSAGFHLP